MYFFFTFICVFVTAARSSAETNLNNYNQSRKNNLESTKMMQNNFLHSQIHHLKLFYVKHLEIRPRKILIHREIGELIKRKYPIVLSSAETLRNIPWCLKTRGINRHLLSHTQKFSQYSIEELLNSPLPGTKRSLRGGWLTPLFACSSPREKPASEFFSFLQLFVVLLFIFACRNADHNSPTSDTS